MFIKATPEQVWDAITNPEFTEKYFHGSRVNRASRSAHPTAAVGRRDQQLVDGEVLEVDPPGACHDVAGAVRPRDGGGAARAV